MDVAGWGLLENVPERAGEEVFKRGEKKGKKITYDKHTSREDRNMNEPSE